MTELEFIESIDCRFPYDDAERCEELVADAIAISPNSVFMIVHELANPPEGAVVEREALLDILDYLDGEFDHPLKLEVFRIARAMIRGLNTIVPHALSALESVAKFEGEYNALGIVYLGCEDPEDEVEQRYEAIVDSWPEA